MPESEHTESNISIECTAEFEAYTYNKSHDIFAIVSLKAPSDSAYGERAAMDIVAVITLFLLSKQLVLINEIFLLFLLIYLHFVILFVLSFDYILLIM